MFSSTIKTRTTPVLCINLEFVSIWTIIDHFDMKYIIPLAALTELFPHHKSRLDYVNHRTFRLRYFCDFYNTQNSDSVDLQILIPILMGNVSFFKWKSFLQTFASRLISYALWFGPFVAIFLLISNFVSTIVENNEENVR